MRAREQRKTSQAMKQIGHWLDIDCVGKRYWQKELKMSNEYGTPGECGVSVKKLERQGISADWPISRNGNLNRG